MYIINITFIILKDNFDIIDTHITNFISRGRNCLIIVSCYH